jgi:hypothetical protein
VISNFLPSALTVLLSPPLILLILCRDALPGEFAEPSRPGQILILVDVLPVIDLDRSASGEWQIAGSRRGECLPDVAYPSG